MATEIYVSELTGKELDDGLRAVPGVAPNAALAEDAASSAAQSASSAASSASSAASSAANTQQSQQDVAAKHEEVVAKYDDFIPKYGEINTKYADIQSHLDAATEHEATVAADRRQADSAAASALSSADLAEASKTAAGDSEARSREQANRAESFTEVCAAHEEAAREYANRIISAESGVVFTTDFQTSPDNIQLITTLPDLSITGQVYGETITHPLTGKNLFDPYAASTVEPYTRTNTDEDGNEFTEFTGYFFKYVLSLTPNTAYLVSTSATWSEVSPVYVNDSVYGECYDGKPVLTYSGDDGRVTIYIRSDVDVVDQSPFIDAPNSVLYDILSGAVKLQVEEVTADTPVDEEDNPVPTDYEVCLPSTVRANLVNYLHVAGAADDGVLHITGRNILVPDNYNGIVNVGGTESVKSYTFTNEDFSKGVYGVNTASIAPAGSSWCFGHLAPVGTPYDETYGKLIEVDAKRGLNLSVFTRQFNVLGITQYDANKLSLGYTKVKHGFTLPVTLEEDCCFVAILYGFTPVNPDNSDFDAGLNAAQVFRDALQLEYGTSSSGKEFEADGLYQKTYAAQAVGPMYGNDYYVIKTGKAYNHWAKLTYTGSDADNAVLDNATSWVAATGQSKDGGEYPSIGAEVVYTVETVIVETEQPMLLTSGYSPDTFACSTDMLLVVPSALLKVKEESSVENVFDEMISTGGGLYRTVKTDAGPLAETYYFHDAPTLEASQNIYTFNSNGFAWTDDWNGGNPTWSAGIAHGGQAVLNYCKLLTLEADTISTAELNADRITAGTIDAGKVAVTNLDADNIVTGVVQSADGKNRIDFATGEFVLDGGSITAGSLTVNAADINGKLTATQIDATNIHISSGNVDGLEIGGRNLALNTGTAVTFSKTQPTYTYFGPVAQFKTSAFGMSGMSINDTYVVTFDWSSTNADEAFNFNLGLKSSSSDYSRTGMTSISRTGNAVPVGNSTGKYCEVFKPSAGQVQYGGDGWAIMNVGASGKNVNCRFVVSNFKFEKGSVYTDWTAAPEDLTDSLANGTTTISGGCITTGTLSANRISGGTINGNNVTITNLNASNITTGTLSADKISSGKLQSTNGKTYFDLTNADIMCFGDNNSLISTNITNGKIEMLTTADKTSSHKGSTIFELTGYNYSKPAGTAGSSTKIYGGRFAMYNAYLTPLADGTYTGDISQVFVVSGDGNIFLDTRFDGGIHLQRDGNMDFTELKTNQDAASLRNTVYLPSVTGTLIAQQNNGTVDIGDSSVSGNVRVRMTAATSVPLQFLQMRDLGKTNGVERADLRWNNAMGYRVGQIHCQVDNTNNRHQLAINVMGPVTTGSEPWYGINLYHDGTNGSCTLPANTKIGSSAVVVASQSGSSKGTYNDKSPSTVTLGRVYVRKWGNLVTVSFYADVSAAISQFQSIITLNTGYRPQENIDFPLAGANNSNTTARFGRGLCYNGGDIQILCPVTGTYSANFSFIVA